LDQHPAVDHRQQPTATTPSSPGHHRHQGPPLPARTNISLLRPVGLSLDRVPVGPTAGSVMHALYSARGATRMTDAHVVYRGPACRYPGMRVVRSIAGERRRARLSAALCLGQLAALAVSIATLARVAPVAAAAEPSVAIEERPITV